MPLREYGYAKVAGSADLRELLRLAALAGPVMGAYVLQMSLGLCNILFVGHIGQLELAAAALGNMYLNVTGYSVVVGLLSAMDTLCGMYGIGRRGVD
jgi:MATE family, multidrug and toxin extrusion protein